MKRSFLIALAIPLAGLASTQAFAVGNLADVAITDRDTGQVLGAHYYRGEYWVAGRPGARYGIQIRNRGAARLLAVTSVDGINVITGDTARTDQNGYVFDALVGYEIAGWRKSDAQVAAFEFTSIPRSYAVRTGRPDNVGVIGVALFRERVAPAERAYQFYENEAKARASDGSRSASAPAAPASAPAPSLGTGHGRRETSMVTQVEFERARTTPDEVIRIRYDSRDNLVAMGVIRESPPARRAPLAFPDEPALSYVPDP